MIRSLRREWVRGISSAVYVGFLPVAPGSFGSLLGFAVAWWAYPALPYVLVLFTLLGFSVCRASEILYGKKDPQIFVMDEVCGMMLSVLWLPRQLWVFVLAFIAFRLLDVFKPWPIKLLQNHAHPHSIMWDDLAAGFFANIFVQILVRFLI